MPIFPAGETRFFSGSCHFRKKCISNVQLKRWQVWISCLENATWRKISTKSTFTSPKYVWFQTFLHTPILRLMNRGKYVHVVVCVKYAWGKSSCVSNIPHGDAELGVWRFYWTYYNPTELGGYNTQSKMTGHWQVQGSWLVLTPSMVNAPDILHKINKWCTVDIPCQSNEVSDGTRTFTRTRTYIHVWTVGSTSPELAICCAFQLGHAEQMYRTNSAQRTFGRHVYRPKT